VAAGFSADSQLVGGKYTLLADPKFVFGFQNVAPVVGQMVRADQGAGSRRFDPRRARGSAPAGPDH